MDEANSSGSALIDGLGVLPPLADARCGNVVVCVPARNEARRLAPLLAALAHQVGLAPRRIRVVLLLNNCTDASRWAAARAAEAVPHLEVRIIERWFDALRAHAGSARRAAMEAGAAWLAEIGGCDGVLLTTDADAVPAADWIARSCAALEAGADVAAASLHGDSAEEARFPAPLRQAVAERLEAERLAIALQDAVDPVPGDPSPRHGHHSGGGLALRLATYSAVGGCPAIPLREDIKLVEALRRRGGIVRHCPCIRVTVSARMRGRASGGMADTIRGWDARVAAGLPIMCPDPAAMEVHWRARAAARRAAAHDFRQLPPAIAARAIAARTAQLRPDPVDWAAEIPTGEAARILKRRLDDLLDPSIAA